MAAFSAQPKFVDDLGEVKDAIGEWHDWEELRAIAQKVLDHGSQCRLLAELKRIANQKYQRALRLTESLRKNYLRTSSPSRNGGAQKAARIPAEPVWKAIAMLAE